jgi:hypothetical protein
MRVMAGQLGEVTGVEPHAATARHVGPRDLDSHVAAGIHRATKSAMVRPGAAATMRKALANAIPIVADLSMGCASPGHADPPGPQAEELLGGRALDDPVSPRQGRNPQVRQVNRGKRSRARSSHSLRASL